MRANRPLNPVFESGVDRPRLPAANLQSHAYRCNQTDAKTAGRCADGYAAVAGHFPHRLTFSTPGQLNGVFTDLDRLLVGGAMPLKPLEMPNHKETGRAFFLERRESLRSTSAGRAWLMPSKSFPLGRLDCAYVPMGTRSLALRERPTRRTRRSFISSVAPRTRRIRRRP